MTYGSTAGLEGDWDVFRLRSIRLALPPAHTGDLGFTPQKEAQMEHRGMEPCSPSVL